MKRKGAKLENTVNWVASVIGGVSLVGMVVLISLNVISRFCLPPHSTGQKK